MKIRKVRALMIGSGRWNPTERGELLARRDDDFYPVEFGAPPRGGGPLPDLYLWSEALEGIDNVRTSQPCRLSVCRHMTPEDAEAHFVAWATSSPPSFQEPGGQEPNVVCAGCGTDKGVGTAGDVGWLQTFRMCGACATQETFARLVGEVQAPRVFRTKH